MEKKEKEKKCFAYDGRVAKKKSEKYRDKHLELECDVVLPTHIYRFLCRMYKLFHCLFQFDVRF